MPVLLIYGIPESQSEHLADLRVSLKKTVASIKELQLKEEEVSCLFLKDIAGDEVTVEEIIVFVKGLYDTTERTEKVRQRLARAICEKIDWCFDPMTKLIECYIEPFQASNGFFAKTG